MNAVRANAANIGISWLLGFISSSFVGVACAQDNRPLVPSSTGCQRLEQYPGYTHQNGLQSGGQFYARGYPNRTCRRQPVAVRVARESFLARRGHFLWRLTTLLLCLQWLRP